MSEQKILDRPELRKEIERLEILFGYALLAYDDKSITIDEMDLYKEYVTDQILARIPKLSETGELLLTDEEIKECEEDARRVSTTDLSTPIDPYWLRQNLIKAQLAKALKPEDRPELREEVIAEQAYTSYTIATSGTIGLDWCPRWVDLLEQHKQEWRSVAKGILALKHRLPEKKPPRLSDEEIIKFFELRQGASEPVEERIPLFGGKSRKVLCRRFRIEEFDWQAFKQKILGGIK